MAAENKTLKRMGPYRRELFQALNKGADGLGQSEPWLHLLPAGPLTWSLETSFFNPKQNDSIYSQDCSMQRGEGPWKHFQNS